MSQFKLHSSAQRMTTVIPNAFIDQFMVHANGEDIKLYLYLLRCLEDPSQSLSLSHIVDFLESSEKDVLRSLYRWQERSLLHLEYDANDQLVGICLNNLIPERAEQVDTRSLSTDAHITEMQTASIVNQDSSASSAGSSLAPLLECPEMQELLMLAESYLRHPLTRRELDSIAYWVQDLALPYDLVEYLIESSVDKNKASISYMDAIARNWKSSNILTPEDAKAHNAQFSSLYGKVKDTLGMQNTNLGKGQTDDLLRWVHDYHLSEEIILEACRRAKDKEASSKFRYIEGTLKNWMRDGVSNLSDVQRLDELYRQKQAKSTSQKSSSYRPSADKHKQGSMHNFETGNVDVEQIEKTLLAQ